MADENAQVAPEQVQTVVPTTDVSTAIETQVDTPQPEATPTPAAPASTPTPQAAAPTPAVDEYAAFKDDPRFKQFTQALKDGKVDDYLLEATKYDRMTPLDIIKEDVKRNNPNLSDKAIDALYQKKLDSYKLDDYDDEQATIAKELLEADAQKIRKGWKDAAPTPTAPQEPSAVDQIKAYQQNAEAQAQQQIEQAVKSITDDPNYKTFETNRIVKTGSEFNYEVPKEVDVVQALTDANTFGKFITNEQGQLDVNKGLRLIAFAANMDAYDKAQVAYGKSLGDKAAFEELANPTTGAVLPNAAQPATTPKFRWGGAVPRDN